MKKSLLTYGSLLGLTLLSACTSSTGPQVDEVKQRQSKNAKAAEVNVQLGLGYLRQGNVRRAKQKLVTAKEQAPNSPDVLGALGYYFEQTDNAIQAERYYRQALHLAPGHGAQLNNYGAFLCRKGKYTEADKFFERASKDLNYMNSAGALENAGLCSLAIPNLAMAKGYFEKAVAQDPKRVKSIYELARIALESKDYKTALRWAEQYQSANPLRADIALIAYQAAEKNKQWKKAESYAWILKTRFPESKEYQELLAGRNTNDNRNTAIS